MHKPSMHNPCCTGWFLAHAALRTDMRLMAEALAAVRTRLNADGMLKAWQVMVLTIAPDLKLSMAG